MIDSYGMLGKMMNGIKEKNSYSTPNMPLLFVMLVGGTIPPSLQATDFDCYCYLSRKVSMLRSKVMQLYIHDGMQWNDYACVTCLIVCKLKSSLLF